MIFLLKRNFNVLMLGLMPGLKNKMNRSQSGVKKMKNCVKTLLMSLKPLEMA